MRRLAGCIDRGLAEVRTDLGRVRADVEVVRRIDACLDRHNGPCEARRAEFQATAERLNGEAAPARRHMGGIMLRWAVGLFAGGDAWDLPQDNLELERFFRGPKSHERKIHGRRHAGVRIVQEGPTLVLALDAHLSHPRPFTAADLKPYADAEMPACQRESLHRRTVMKRARSRARRGTLLAELEARYRAVT